MSNTSTDSEEHGIDDLVIPMEEQDSSDVPTGCCEKFNAKKYFLGLFPFATWIREYDLKGNMINDVLAGVTVGFMLIPQAMAYAIVASLPPIHGLYASIFATIMYMFFGTSRELAVGPVAMVSLLVTSSVSTLPGVVEAGDETYIGYVLLLTLMVGVFQLLMGLLRVGVIVNYLSHSVISGFTSAAAIIIGWSQLKHAFGVSPESAEYFYLSVYEFFVVIGETNLVTLLMCVITIILLLVIKTINRKKGWIIPGSLIVVVLSIIISFVLNLAGDHEVKVIGDIPSGFPTPKAPPVNWDAFVALIVPTAIISIVGYMESVAVAQKISIKKDYEISPTQELVALGLTNIVTSFFQGYSVTGGFSRTAVADNAGAKTPLYNIFAAVIVTSSILFLTKIIYYLCMNTLAAIILVAVYGLLDYETAIELWKVNKRDFVLMIISFLCTLLIGVEIGLFVAVGISMLFVIMSLSRPHISILGLIPGSRDTYRNVKRYKTDTWDNILIIRIDAPLFFANTVYLKAKILKQVRSSEAKNIIIDMSGINDLDSAGIHFLEELQKLILKMNKKIYLASPIGPVRTKMRMGKIDEHYGRKRIHWTIKESVEHIHHIRKKTEDETYQPYVFHMEERALSSNSENV